MKRSFLSTFVTIICAVSSAGAQEEAENTSDEPVESGLGNDSSEESAATAQPAESPPPTEASSQQIDADETRFRWGISGGGGIVAVASQSLGYGGIDLRFGAQINDLIGVYGQPQLGFYSNGGLGVGGLVGATALVDFTFADSFFVAGGLGYGVLNNPAGFELHARGGWYPIVGGGQDEARRRAMMLGVDFRVFFLDGATAVSPTLSLGYESF